MSNNLTASKLSESSMSSHRRVVEGWHRWIGRGGLPVMSPPCKFEISRESVALGRAIPRARCWDGRTPKMTIVWSARQYCFQGLEIYVLDQNSVEGARHHTLPCRQIGHELDNSNNQGSTQVWWNRWFPSQGKTRKSSPSSKPTIQIGHVSRPIAAGTTSSDELCLGVGERGWGDDALGSLVNGKGELVGCW
jgi:hypothetical protein